MPWVLPGSADAGDVYTATAHNVIVEDMRTLAAAGTVLPTSPGDGESFYYVADATNGVVWHLRYRSAATGSYKWEFVGGAEAVAESTSNFGQTTSATYGNPTGGAMPTIVCPLAGDYDVTVYAEDTRLVTNSGRGFISYTIGGAAALDANALIRGTFSSSDDNGGTMMSKNRITGVSAAATLALVTKVSGSATFYPNGDHGVSNAAVGVRIVPVRVG